MDLYEQIESLMAELTASIKQLRKNGEKLAETERDYKITLTTQALKLRAEDMPTADAIVVLGGGMTANKAVYPYADISEAGDRVWHAARLYRAGKAPLVVPTGCNDKDAVVPLLLDLGVPSTALRVEDEARNTEENARFVATMLKDVVPGRKPRILLVTSAIHMRRALLMYSRYASELDIIPRLSPEERLHPEGAGWILGLSVVASLKEARSIERNNCHCPRIQRGHPSGSDAGFPARPDLCRLGLHLRGRRLD